MARSTREICEITGSRESANRSCDSARRSWEAWEGPWGQGERVGGAVVAPVAAVGGEVRGGATIGAKTASSAKVAGVVGGQL